jgi:hypothetical protein
MEQSEILVIKEEAKKLLEKFSKSLESVKSEKGEWNVEREMDRRAEKEGKSCDNDFRKILFENAPSKDSDFLIAEKKSW